MITHIRILTPMHSFARVSFHNWYDTELLPSENRLGIDLKTALISLKNWWMKDELLCVLKFLYETVILAFLSKAWAVGVTCSGIGNFHARQHRHTFRGDFRGNITTITYKDLTRYCQDKIIQKNSRLYEQFWSSLILLHRIIVFSELHGAEKNTFLGSRKRALF